VCVVLGQKKRRKTQGQKQVGFNTLNKNCVSTGEQETKKKLN
jgi:hypothetical protein